MKLTVSESQNHFFLKLHFPKTTYIFDSTLNNKYVLRNPWVLCRFAYKGRLVSGLFSGLDMFV